MAIHEGQTRTESSLSSAAASGTDFVKAQRAIIQQAGLSPRSKYLDIQHPTVRIHYHDFGEAQVDQPPLVMLHSGGTFGVSFAPLMAHLGERRIIAVDRPGYGLSTDLVYTEENYRQTVIAVLDGLMDELDVEQVDLIGNSAGGYWSLVYALTEPKRVRKITIAGSVPTFPGTSAPIPLRMFTLPLFATLVAKLQPPSRQSVIKQYEMFGEGEAIQAYPEFIEAIVAQQRNPRTVKVETSEFRSFLRLRGWHSATRLHEAALSDIEQPTLFIWGEEDPLGRPDAVRDTIGGLQHGHLESVTGVGHIPWLGEPEHCAELVSRFIDSTEA